MYKSKIYFIIAKTYVTILELMTANAVGRIKYFQLLTDVFFFFLSNLVRARPCANLCLLFH